MSKFFRRSSVALIVFAFSLVLAGAGARGQAAPQTAAPSQAPKMAEEVFKNIQVLKGVPADQLIPAMQFIAASLGVECDFCHVRNAFEKDDKDQKVAARKMMQMMFAANKETFEGKREVTCYTCHRGSTDPVGTPVIPEAEPKPATEVAAAPSENLPKADQLIDKYVAALGGKDAIQKITSRVEKGSLTAGEMKATVDVYAKAPGQAHRDRAHAERRQQHGIRRPRGLARHTRPASSRNVRGGDGQRPHGCANLFRG